MDLVQIHIGVVDDDPRVLESLEELLAAGGYHAFSFPSAEAFIDSNEFRRVDCLISDIGMPAMSGLELLQITRAERPGLPVILITGREEQYQRASLESNGARHLFRKPFDGKQLLATLDEILRPLL
jgi:FixJ family two-component response regulator